MNLANKILVAGLLIAVALPAWATFNGDSDYKAYCELIRKCPLVAVIYVTGDPEEAQKRAKELLPLVEKINKEKHYHAFDNDLNMLRAVINNDSKAIEDYMENDYHAPTRGRGLKIGLKESLKLSERELALTIADSRYGEASWVYLNEGCNVAAMMYAVGRAEEAKSLANKCLPLLEPVRKEEKEQKTLFPFNCDSEESVLKGILADDKTAVKTFIQKHLGADIEDSIGCRLEEAYGKIYLYKRLEMDLDHLAYAYNYLGWAQAVAGNYDESERAYKVALREAMEQYGGDSIFAHPEIPLLIKSDYAAMLSLSGKKKEAAKLTEEVRSENLKAAKAKSHPEQPLIYFHGSVPGWGP